MISFGCFFRCENHHFFDNYLRFWLPNPSKMTQKSSPVASQSVTRGSWECLRSALDQFGWARRCPEVLPDRFWLDFYLFLVGYGFDFAYILGLSWLESSALRAYMNHECGWPRRSHSHVCTVQHTNTQANVHGISNESLTVRSDVGLTVPIFWESWFWNLYSLSWIQDARVEHWWARRETRVWMAPQGPSTRLCSTLHQDAGKRVWKN